MEKYRAARIVTATLAAAVAFPIFDAHATGGDSFDEPAPSLGESLDFLPGKSLGEIFLETSPAADEGEEPDFSAEIVKLAEQLRTEPTAPLVQQVDRLIVQARQHYSGGGGSCNLLHDVRDVISGATPQDRAEAAEYLKWRAANDMGASADDVEKRAATASPSLKPHWFYLCGAHTFRAGDRTACVKWFERIVKEYPKHPRAEIALFMLARCAFSATRADDNDGYPAERTDAEKTKIARLQKSAEDLFVRYRKQYPHGRFDADALGWIGALAYDAGNYLKALDAYIDQAESPGHPETLKSAVFMCEKCLVRVAAKPDATAAIALVARHPRIAMGFTYFVLSAPEADDYDGKYDPPAVVKKWRRTILPRIAAAVAKQKDLYKAEEWRPRYLALLAQAASAAGNQAEALQLTNLSREQLEGSDDLLLVRALAFSRSGKPLDAIAAYRTLIEKFPESPLVPGVRLRLALALQDTHQAGDAVVQLRQLSKPVEAPAATPAGKNDSETGDTDADASSAEPTIGGSRYTVPEIYPGSLDAWRMSESAVYPNITGAEIDQVNQAIDTLLNFAPLTELALALENAQLDQEAKLELRKIIAERYLTAENFTEAKKFGPSANEAIAANLEKLTAAAAPAGGDKADELLKLGDAWSEARGKLLPVPLDTRLTFLADRATPPDLLKRRANGRSLGLKNVDAELSERDELRHAARWWMNAARARPGSPLAATARWKALEAMPKLARQSEYAEQLAREINGEAVSREIYAKLRSECPNSIEAKRLAAYWNFPAASDASTTSEYAEPMTDRDANILGYPLSDQAAFELKNRENDYTAWAEIGKRTEALRAHSRDWPVAKMRAEVGELDAMARKSFADETNAAWVNCFDDLVQFFSERNVTPEMQQVYVNIRLNVLHRTSWSEQKVSITTDDNDEAVDAEIKAALGMPVMKPVSDYLELCALGLVAGARIDVQTDIPDTKGSNGKATYAGRDYATMEKMARQFLAKYPRSKKREAAMFVLARSVQARSRPYICNVGVPPEGEGQAEADDVAVRQQAYMQEPFDAKRVLDALDEYDREFPSGRYAADIRNYRAMALWRVRDWPKAIELTTAQLDDTSHPELQPEAAVRLANIFAALEQSQTRADVLDAIRSRPASVRRLQQYLAIAPRSRTHPLRYLVSYLSDQLNLKALASN